MKKQIMLTALITSIVTIIACNNNPPKDEPGIKVEGKKGGEMKIDKDKLQIEGKNGGQLKIDSNGAEIKKPQPN